MPNVERVLGTVMEDSSNPVVPVADSRKFANRPPGRATGLAGLNSSTNAPPPNRIPSNPPSATSPTGGGQTQHEVLQNFFQSLLSSKDRAGGKDRNAATGQSPPKTSGQSEDAST